MTLVCSASNGCITLKTITQFLKPGGKDLFRCRMENTRYAALNVWCWKINKSAGEKSDKLLSTTQGTYKCFTRRRTVRNFKDCAN